MNQNYQKIEKLIKETYLIADPGIVKLLCAGMLSHYISGRPAWIFIVGASSSGKTALLDGLTEIKNAHSISSITPKTLVSGMKKVDQETSLLHIIGSGIILMKDFTSIISMHDDDKKQIFGQLREIYDGRYVKRFGNGFNFLWEGKISIIAGVTEAIYQAREMFASLGERFIMYCPILPDRYEMAYETLGPESDSPAREAEIRAAFNEYINGLIENMPDTMEISDDLRKELANLADFATRARSPVQRDWRNPRKPITRVYTPEMPARFAKQLKVLAQSLMLMNEDGKLNEIDYYIIHKLALDSIDMTRILVLRELARYNLVSTAGLATKINHPTDTTRMVLEDLDALKVCNRIKGSNKDEWQLKDSYKKIVQQLENIENGKMRLMLKDIKRSMK